MKKRTLLLTICFAVLCLNAAPVMADLSLYVDIDDTEMTITPAATPLSPGATATGDVSILYNSNVSVTLENNDIGVDDALIFNLFDFDSVAADFDAGASITFTWVGVDDWTAAGNIWVSDAYDPGTESPTNRIEADFVSTSVQIDAFDLYIRGLLSPYSTNNNEAILTGATTGNPWTFTGEQDSGLSGSGNDSVADQVSVDDWENWDSGDIVVFHFTVPTNSLDTLFTTQGVLDDGNMDINIIPIPPSMILGIIGLCVVGLKLRKYA